MAKRKREWIPVSKENPCPICGKGNWCSISTTDENFTTCKRTSTTPSGWSKLKDTTDGGGVYKLIDNNHFPGIVTTNNTTTKATSLTSEEYQPVNHQTRDLVYRRLIHKSGHLAKLYQNDLLWRKLSSDNINEGIKRGWFANWQRGIVSDFCSNSENISGINPQTGRTGSCDGMFLPAIRDGQIIGGQNYPRVHIESKQGKNVTIPADLGKYIWISSDKQGGVNARSFDTGENPLFLREHPDIQPEDIQNLNLCEGALKSAIASLQFEERGRFEPFLGASGAIFSEGELQICLTRYPNLKTVTLWPDAGSIQNLAIFGKYQKAIGLVKKLTDGKITALVAWWGQTTKEARDVDELTEEDFANLITETWGNSIMVENVPTNSEANDGGFMADGRPHFESSIEEGLVWISFKKNEEGEVKLTRTEVGNHLEAVARINNPDQNGAALHLEFKTVAGAIRRWTMPRSALAGDGSVIIAGLFDLDYTFKRKQKALLLDYLQGLGADIDETFTVTESSGWVKKSFVMPHKTYGDDTLRFRDVDPSPESLTETVGTLEGWKTDVAARCAGNSRLILALGAAFAAPLLPVVDVESGGFHLVGPTSQGKTTILAVAGSVTGIKDIPHWRTTTNGLESTATAFNHLLLPLDEIGQADPRDVGNIAYMLANGQGKARMKKDLTDRKGKTWQLMVLSSGEVGLGGYMKQANITQKGGQEVRLPDIPAVPEGSAYGCFETIHAADNAPQFVNAIEAAVKQHHGMAMDAFLSRLVADHADHNFAGQLSKKVHLIAAKLSEGTVDSAIGRVAKRFALVQVALGLAYEYGLIPFPVEQIDWAVATIFTDWLKARGGDGSIEVKQALEKIEYLLTTNEFSDRVYKIYNSRGDDSQPVRNLLAYRNVGSNGQTEEFWVPPSVFEKEFCEGVNKSELIKELQRRHWLIPPRSDGKARYQKTVNGKVIYFYVFRIWKNVGEEGEESEELSLNSIYQTVLDSDFCLPHTNVLGEEGEEVRDKIVDILPPLPPPENGGKTKIIKNSPLQEGASGYSSDSSPSSPKKTHIPNITPEIEQKALRISLPQQSFEKSRLIGDIGYEE